MIPCRAALTVKAHMHNDITTKLCLYMRVHDLYFSRLSGTETPCSKWNSSHSLAFAVEQKPRFDEAYKTSFQVFSASELIFLTPSNWICRRIRRVGIRFEWKRRCIWVRRSVGSLRRIRCRRRWESSRSGI